jgi:hypothetical protein
MRLENALADKFKFDYFENDGKVYVNLELSRSPNVNYSKAN